MPRLPPAARTPPPGQLGVSRSDPLIDGRPVPADSPSDTLDRQPHMHQRDSPSPHRRRIGISTPPQILGLRSRQPQPIQLPLLSQPARSRPRKHHRRSLWPRTMSNRLYTPAMTETPDHLAAIRSSLEQVQALGQALAVAYQAALRDPTDASPVIELADSASLLSHAARAAADITDQLLGLHTPTMDIVQARARILAHRSGVAIEPNAALAPQAYDPAEELTLVDDAPVPIGIAGAMLLVNPATHSAQRTLEWLRTVVDELDRHIADTDGRQP